MKHNRLTIPLDGITDSGQSIVGAKAVGLAHLKRLGLPIPDAFCITANAFASHINSPYPAAIINDAFLLPREPKNLDIVKILAEVRRAITEAPMDSSLVAEIESRCRALAADRLSVRSSATAEDLPSHSFAGLYDTYLGIANVEDCLMAIKKCWASLWTERAYNYRQKNGFDHLKAKMAVIVQSLIPADASGVLFTADPVTCDDNRIIIEACLGLGDALVSGKVTPDRVVLNKSNISILSRTVSQKTIQHIVPQQGGIEEQNVPADLASAPCINNEMAQKLAELAIKAETEFGCPQDIEWAICRNEIFLLQSRPITTIRKAKSWADRQIWSSFGAHEVIPDVVTPATFSVLRFFEEKISKFVSDVLCIDNGNIPAFDLIAGRVYFNAGLWTAVIRHFRILRNLDWNELAGSEPEMIRLIEELKRTPTEDLPAIRHNHLRFILRLPLLIAGILGNNRRKSQAVLEVAKKINEKWDCLDVSRLSPEQVTDRLMEAIADLLDRILNKTDFLRMFYCMVYFPILDVVCRRWIPDEQFCAGKLVAGVGNMVDAEAGFDLWRLAVKVNENLVLKKLIQSNAGWDVVRDGLVRSPAGEEFLDVWNRFMKAHGHHCRGEVEIYNRRWSETPDYVLGILRGYLNSMEKTNPLENQRRIAGHREQFADRCRQKLRNPLKRAVFNYLLTQARYGSAFRENFKSEVVKLIASARSILLELGRKLAAGSIIADSNDVFFLKFEEIGPLAREQFRADIKQIIAARRAEYKKWRSVTPPSVIFGRFDPDTYVPAGQDTNADLLDGLAVSPGVVTGKARVILRSDTKQQVQAGEILIAPFTDPGWTPYFVTAAGVVMEQGGLLSHGAIVAREYGIPAVVNVGNATKIIKTGQTIQVDGDKGVVRILK
jgi:pyruvate,water dikinase